MSVGISAGIGEEKSGLVILSGSSSWSGGLSGCRVGYSECYTTSKLISLDCVGAEETFFILLSAKYFVCLTPALKRLLPCSANQSPRSRSVSFLHKSPCGSTV